MLLNSFTLYETIAPSIDKKFIMICPLTYYGIINTPCFNDIFKRESEMIGMEPDHDHSFFFRLKISQDLLLPCGISDAARETIIEAHHSNFTAVD